MFTGLTGFPISDDWNRRGVRNLFRATRWNQYVANWSMTLSAMRRLWEAGKVSELKTPFYEAVEKPTLW